MTAWIAGVAAVVVLAGAVSCGGSPPAPAALDPRNDACAHCRMAVSEQRFAGQLVAPSEEPRFFDDLGCLRDYLREHPSLPAGSVAYVADHRSREWVAAEKAVYTRVSTVHTPMASGLIAHRDGASRERDPDAAGGSGVPATEILGSLAAGGRRR